MTHPTPDEIRELADGMERMIQPLGALNQSASYADLGVWLWNNRNAIQSVLRQAPEPPKVEEWQPIESAPKDGSQFMGYFPDLGWINNRGEQQGCNYHVCWYGVSLVSGKKRLMVYGAGDLMDESVQPTHWMPLPPLPTRADGGAE